MTTALLVSQVLLWVVVLALALVVLAVARQVGVLFERVAPVGALIQGAGPQAGAMAPRLVVPALAGGDVAIGSPRGDARAQMLLFVSAQCPICKTLIPVAKRVARDEGLELVFAGDADPAEQRALVDAQDMGGFPFLNSAELGRAFAVAKLPHAVLIDGAGRIVAQGLVNSREHLESLVVARELGVGSVQDYLRDTRTQAAE
ncbi:methylamine utilization protein MauD [Sphingomonas sp. CJ20]